MPLKTSPSTNEKADSTYINSSPNNSKSIDTSSSSSSSSRSPSKIAITAEDHFEAIKSELEIKLSRLRCKKVAHEERRQSLSKRRQDIIANVGRYKNDNNNNKRLKLENGKYAAEKAKINDEEDDKECKKRQMSINNIIKLNIGGKYKFVSRETLTVIQESRLGILFNGMNDDRIMKDQGGCIFLDVDPLYFDRILSYLYEVKELEMAGKDGRMVNAPSVANEEKQFDAYLKFFGLQRLSSLTEANKICYEEGKVLPTNTATSNNNTITSPEYRKEEVDNPSNKQDLVKQEHDDHHKFKSFDSALEKEEYELEIQSKDLDEIEKNIAKDENFIRYFQQPISHPEQNMHDYALDLYLQNGEILTVKRSTLCIFRKSRLTKDFRDDTWIAKNTFRNESGKDLVLIEHPSEEFTMIVNLLRIRAILRSDKEVPAIYVPNNPTSFQTLLSRLLPGKEHYFKKIDSNILSTGCHETILSWLLEVNVKSKPQLLYRASSSGWSVNEFHAACDGKGLTITIVKTEEGYIFGGYSDRSWHGVNTYAKSKSAFLFSFKCHANFKPTKMNILSSEYHKAIFPAIRSGPTFGSGYDLQIGTNGKDLKNGSSTMKSFVKPSNASNTFLAGRSNFKIAEIEIFKC